MRPLATCVLSLILSLASVSCSTAPSNTSTLTSQSLGIFDRLTAQDKNYLGNIKFERTDITEGVISDYVEIIEYLAARHDLKEDKIIPTPFFPRAEKYPQVVLFYKGRYKIDNGKSKIHRSEWCEKECETILLGDHAESVLRVEIDVETLDAVPDSVRKFEKANLCDTSRNLNDDYTFHPCLTMTIPDNGAELLTQDGLYVYGDQISPLWPEVFFIDGSKLIPDAGILAIAYSRPIEAFNHLEHVRAYLKNKSDHRAIVEKRHGLPDKTSMFIDHIDLAISPELPNQIIDHLIKETVGVEYFSNVEQDGEKLWTGDPGEISLGHDFNDGEELFKE